MFNIFKKTKKVKHPSRDKRRSFTTTQKKHIWYLQNGACANCDCVLDLRTVQYDHVERWADDGRTSIENCEALCANCHAMKNHREAFAALANR